MLYSALGPIPVERVENIPNSNPEATTMGQYSTLARTVQLSNEVKSAESMLATMGHEWVHSILMDAGVSNLMSRENEESICDAIGTALAGAALNGYLVFRNGK